MTVHITPCEGDTIMATRFLNVTSAMLVAIGGALLFSMVLGPAWGDDAQPAAAKAQIKAAPGADGKSPAAAKTPAKPKGRLPNYYGQVVSGEQREKIYAIQAKYAAEIESLQAKLAELDGKVIAEVEAVLTSEQRERVAKLRSEAAAKAKKPAPAATDKPSDAPSAAPAKTSTTAPPAK
jgi:hypothetical protein